MESQLVEFGRHAARGAAIALRQSGHTLSQVSRVTLDGSLESMVIDQAIPAEEALLAASIGALEGSIDPKNTFDEAVEATTAAAIDSAAEFGVDRETAVDVVNDAARRVAESLTDDSSEPG